MMNQGSYDLQTLSLPQLADLREWQLERLERVTIELRNRVKTAYADGAEVKALAKECGVTRVTMYRWLEQ
jgi:transposase-like protein